MIRTVILSTCLLVVTGSVPAVAGPLKPAHVPASADLVVHFDIDEFKRSKLYKMFASDINKSVAELTTELQKQGLKLSASDLTTIGGLTFWAEGSNPERGAMIATGVRTRTLLKAATKLPNFKVARHGGYVMTQIDVDGDETFIGATSSVLVIAENKRSVAKTLDAITKRKGAPGSPLAARLNRSGGMLVAGAFGDAIAKKIRKEADTPMFKNLGLKRGAVFASERGRNLVVRTVLEHASASGANQLVQLGQAALTMASFGGDDPDLAALAKSVSISSSGNRATISVDIPYRLLKKLSKGRL